MNQQQEVPNIDRKNSSGIIISDDEYNVQNNFDITLIQLEYSSKNLINIKSLKDFNRTTIFEQSQKRISVLNKNLDELLQLFILNLFNKFRDNESSKSFTKLKIFVYKRNMQIPQQQFLNEYNYWEDDATNRIRIIFFKLFRQIQQKSNIHDLINFFETHTAVLVTLCLIFRNLLAELHQTQVNYLQIEYQEIQEIINYLQLDQKQLELCRNEESKFWIQIKDLQLRQPLVDMNINNQQKLKSNSKQFNQDININSNLNHNQQQHIKQHINTHQKLNQQHIKQQHIEQEHIKQLHKAQQQQIAPATTNLTTAIPYSLNRQSRKQQILKQQKYCCKLCKLI